MGFWDFSLKVYADADTARACLDLQNRFDFDVNLLLFCLYAGSHGRRLSTDDLRQLDETVRPWRSQVVHPLRAVRAWIKSAASGSAADAVRRQVLAAELAAEHHQQVLMERALPIAPGGMDREASAANLCGYATALGRPPGGPLQAALATLHTLASDALERPAAG